MKEKFMNLIRKYSDDENYNSECWTEIENNYLSKFRYYHNLEHLENMFLELDKVKCQVKKIETLQFSIFYHDIIYKPAKNDNEHQSALILEKRLSNTSFKNIGECMAQIEATKDHKLSNDNDVNILLDLDLSILGKSRKKYKEYTENIRKEYQIYPDFLYSKGRKRILKNLLELDYIYKTDFFKQEYENQARTNLKFELKQLNNEILE